jgi:hypothetical protein
MAVEIRELVIRASTKADGEDDDESGPATPNPEMDELVAKAVKQVLRILERKQER